MSLIWVLNTVADELLYSFLHQQLITYNLSRTLPNYIAILFDHVHSIL